MRPGELTSGPAALHKAWKNLLVHWETTKLQWHDVVSREFEENHLAKLEPQINTAIERMRGLAAIMIAAKNECDQGD